ncbi:unnamed protein product [Ilex paraguariensis]|uniref:GDSL esterase/lipase n=1 Tax=Ilex paraguariensis TaxID=185542 RepID=A0ABC8SBX4_9AQUA
MRPMVVAAVVVVVLLLAAMPLQTRAVDVHQLRIMAAKNNITCMLVFGDSSVDPGNNNHLATSTKANFPPYGKDFFNGLPTGRFSNGRLATDFIADAFWYTKIVKGFLDPQTRTSDVVHGVSFASAGSGYDDLTANLSVSFLSIWSLQNVLPVSKQLEYLRHYKIHLRQMVGEKKTEDIIRSAIFVVSMGTNDFLQNYYAEPIRSKQFSVQQYQDYLISCMSRDVKEMHSLGARRLVMVGVPPLGCLPLIKTLRDETRCDAALNRVAFSFGIKLKERLAILKESLGLRTTYVDIYSSIQRSILNPKRYGFTETSKGCCGSGMFEYGGTCRGLNTCADPTKYVFWDAVHPTEKMYKIIADEALKSIGASLFN